MASKKTNRVTLPASKCNYHRVWFGTHTMSKVLKLEGYDVVQDEYKMEYVVLGERKVPLELINLRPKTEMDVSLN